MTKWGLEYLSNVQSSLPSFDNNNFPVPQKKRTLSLKDLKTTGVNKDSNREYIEMINDDHRHRFKEGLDENDVWLWTER